MTGGAAIFVKTPGRSPLKTRLAARLGTAFAEAWYLRAAAAVAAVLRATPGLAGYWAVAETTGQDASAWPGLPLLEQGEGELGARMGRVHAALLERHPFALLLGADTPQIEARLLERAADWLASDAPRFVLGPARDGGFWLLGGNRQPPAGDWLATPCSTPDTARGFRSVMARHGAWLELPLLTDVDDADDLGAMLAELAALAAPLAEQQALAAWTRTELS